MTIDLELMTAIGVYDPDDPGAAERRDLLEWLVAQGVTTEELVQARERDRVFALGGDRILRPGRDAFTLGQVAKQLDADPELVHRAWRALGLPDQGMDTPAASPGDVQAIAVCLRMAAGLGEQTMLSLARSYGAAMATVAHAEVAATRDANAEVSLELTGSEMVTARAWVRAVSAVPDIGRLLDSLHRHHLEASMRQYEQVEPGEGQDWGQFRMAIGFVDLCGFTQLSQGIDSQTLSSWLTSMEEATYDVVTGHGGRVVKFIGDAAMFAGPRPADVAAIAEALVCATTMKEEVLVRGGIAYGPVLAQDGDYFGGPVNLAARLVAAAAPGKVLASAELVERLDDRDWECRAGEPLTLRGWNEPVVAYDLRRRSPAGA
jgi:class 3 adenylate cyclase